MDLRDFFKGLATFSDDFESFFGEPQTGGGGLFEQLESLAPSPARNVPPRELMLKRSYLRQLQRSKLREKIALSPSSGIGELFADLDVGHGKFHSESFIQTFSSGPGGVIEEKIVIRDSDGNEKIITRSSGGNANRPTKQTEMERRGGEIVSQKEILSDIGDDPSQIQFDKLPGNSQKSSKSAWNLLDWLRVR